MYGVQNGIVSTGNIITKKQHSSSPAPPPILGIHILYIQVLWFAEDNINSFLFFNFNFQVLLLVDASFGFEMETFEFLNICQVHGFPRIMGVLTHLDAFKDNKQMRKTKKRLKHRFWTEVYQVNCLWEIISTGYHIWSNAAILIYILHIKLKREITYNNFLFFKSRKDYWKSFLSWSMIVVCKTGFISWNVTEKYTFIDGWVSKRKELPITDGPKEQHFNLQILC